MRSAWIFGVCSVLFGTGCSDDGPVGQPTTGGAGGSTGGGGNAGAMTGGGGASGGSVSGAAGGGAGGTQAGTAGGGAGGAAAGSGGAGGSGGTGGAPVALADFQLYGRWDVTHAGKAITVNSGSHVTSTFHGSGLSAKFDVGGNDTNVMPTVAYKIDGGDWVEKEISATLELASGLPVADHTVLLFVRGMDEKQARWTPPLVSVTIFLGFDVAGGALVPTPRPERMKIEFLGDSITEGVAVHDKGPAGQTGANWRTDGPRGYASLTGMAMNAEYRQVGFGRQGLTVGGNGGVPKAQDALDFFYAGVPRDDWQPDLVVINQGTNDSGASSETFAPLYLGLLGKVRTAYPGARIAALRPFGGAHAADISAQVTARKDGGDAQVFYVDTTGWTAAGDFTDGVHPNVPGSVKISAKLVTALQALPK
jgi:lysophospholipase L1-like esterase